MDLNKLTLKSQEALSSAQNIAVTMGHTEVDGEHLLLSLLRQEGGLIPRLLTRMDAHPEEIALEAERELSRRSRVSGPSGRRNTYKQKEAGRAIRTELGA